MQASKEREIAIQYINYRCDLTARMIVPQEGGLTFQATEHHKEPQWILKAWDVGKQADRGFALKDVARIFIPPAYPAYSYEALKFFGQTGDVTAAILMLALEEIKHYKGADEEGTYNRLKEEITNGRK